MGLFDKKYCDICGEKIGLLGNRKLEDGNCCKDCAGKLSPWFSERKKSTVEDIKGQLAYREANKSEVAAFNTTRTLGRGTKIYFDEDAKKFLVTSAKNLKDANPDVLSFSQVTGCTLDIQESNHEEKREVKKPDGTTERVSFIPPKYVYNYSFYMIINVNSPYFTEIRFPLSNSISVNVVGHMAGKDPSLISAEYDECYKMGQEIKQVLTNVREQVREQINSANAPKMATTCPYCGAATIADENGCCEYCGGALN